MHKKVSLQFILAAFLCLVILHIGLAAENEQKKAMTFKDVMKFKEIHSPVISEDGAWLAYSAQPGRGDGEVQVQCIKTGKVFTVKRGSKPVISKDSCWVVMNVKPEAVELEKSVGLKKPKQGMAILETKTGKIKQFEKVEQFALSNDSKWLAFCHFKEEKADKEKPEKEAGEKPESAKEKKKEKIGSTMVLLNLESKEKIQIPYVISFSFDKSSKYFVYAVAGPEGKDNGLYYIELNKEDLAQNPIAKKEKGNYVNLTWSREASKLAFLESVGEGETKGIASLFIWNGIESGSAVAVAAGDVPEGWFIPEKNKISWSRDGKRLFFGLKPEEFHDTEENKKAEEEKVDLFSFDRILAKKEVDVWHWNDPFIIPHQKKMWPRIKDQTYLAVYHVDLKSFTQLADREVPDVHLTENPNYALGISDVPYRKEITWYGELKDVYRISLKDGSRKKVASRLEDRCSISPEGRYVIYYKDKHWHLFDGNTGTEKNLTDKLNVPFFNEDHDYPSSVPGYGVPGWIKKDRAVLIYDKYDVWKFSTETGEALNITAGEGRRNQITFRVVRMDPEKLFYAENEKFLLSAYHNMKKNFGFYSCNARRPGIKRLLEEKKKFRFIAKAKKADVLIYTRESYKEFPDIWTCDLKFSSPKKQTDVNPQISEFAWGSAELVEWGSADGIPLQGVLIKPGNYNPGKRYPVFVYFYRFFTQRLYEFNQIVVNHRPCFPFYASNGYAVFLPDIRFEVGHPGFSATKCLVPGVQKLIDMGIADPKAIGLHGHSWSGYQTAFVVTQTNMFAAAIAGAPVSNMTSAYSGIRWGSGLARQFQYEKSQSRIGGSLWEFPELYIENSPVFFAPRIQTPLLIMFGDNDGAVPWYQGIELYLAMRRLGKDCIFLQYRGEPHHPQKYPNKLDYSIRMKEYFDHYLKGKSAPDWIKKGVPYRGK